jgi:tetratricopeptide (TPR) repeat protein
MSIWDRVKEVLGGRRSTGDVAFEGDRVVLRDLERARTFPQEPAESGRKAMGICEKCSGTLRRVVFTTAGGGEQLKIWRAYPLAIDGWLCPACGWSALPRFISVEESVEYGRRGAEQAQSGNLDDAEFWFRRILGSWPGYGAGYADLGQLSLTRADATTDAGERVSHRKRAEELFRKALATGGKLGGVRTPLARTLVLMGREEEAIELLGDLERDAEAGEAMRAEGRELLRDIQAGKGLFTRASELLRELVLQPPTQRLEPSDRRRIEEGRALLRASIARKPTFASQWFLGKTEQRTQNFAVAAEAFERACALDPQHPDGPRELANAYLELGRNADALTAAERALALRPDDATLRCNLAFVLLLTGDLKRAEHEAKLAGEADPSDAITRNVEKLINDVASGKRKQPKTLAEAEGRR